MKEIDLQEFLEISYQELDSFFNPYIANGFFEHWASWVVKNWSEESYFDSETVNLGFDSSVYPEKTDTNLKEKCKTYIDFINSNTGETLATYSSGSGIECQKYEELLREQFANAATNKINEISELYNIYMPKRYKEEIDECKTISEIIGREFFNHKTDKKLYDAADSLMCDFGVLGYKIVEFGYPPEIYYERNKGQLVERYEKTWCADLTLDDIKSILKNKSSHIN